MRPWSREILLVVVVAVLAYLAGPAEGFTADRAKREADENEVAEEDKPVTENPPSDMSVGCDCEDNASPGCHCGLHLAANIMGKHISFEPKVNVEFVPENVSIVMSVTNGDSVLFSREISGEDNIPPVCIPVPSFPVVGICVEFHDLHCNREEKTVSFCTVFGLNTFPPMPVPFLPKVPLGCFTAGSGKGIAYTAPEFKLPGKEQLDKLIANVPQLPKIPQIPKIPQVTSPFSGWSFEGIKRAVSWPFGGSAAHVEETELVDKPDAEVETELEAAILAEIDSEGDAEAAAAA